MQVVAAKVSMAEAGGMVVAMGMPVVTEEVSAAVMVGGQSGWLVVVGGLLGVHEVH